MAFLTMFLFIIAVALATTGIIFTILYYRLRYICLCTAVEKSFEEDKSYMFLIRGGQTGKLYTVSNAYKELRSPRLAEFSSFDKKSKRNL
jgi:hypothetical protein